MRRQTLPGGLLLFIDGEDDPVDVWRPAIKQMAQVRSFLDEDAAIWQSVEAEDGGFQTLEPACGCFGAFGVNEGVNHRDGSRTPCRIWAMFTLCKISLIE